jgi:hypothetical protein
MQLHESVRVSALVCMRPLCCLYVRLYVCPPLVACNTNPTPERTLAVTAGM